MRWVGGVAGVAVVVVVDHPQRPLAAERLHDRVGDRVVAADRQRHDAGRHHLVDEGLDVVEALLEAEAAGEGHVADVGHRSEEHTSELQSLMRISYAVFCLKKKIPKTSPQSKIIT